MKKNKGFTLIELLAVIVILAILALIAIPIVISIINDSRESSHKRSIENYGRSVENAIAKWQSEHNEELPTDLGKYEIKTSGEKVVCDNEIKGLDGDDGIELTNCRVVDGKGNSKSKEYIYKNGQVSEESNSGNNNKEYNVGKEIYDKINNEKYYVIEHSDSDQEYVTALKENPLTADEINTYGEGHVNMNQLAWTHYRQAYEYGDSNHTGGMAYYNSPSCGIKDYRWVSDGCSTSYSISDVRYVVDKWSQAKFANNELIEVDGYSARLITYDELKVERKNICTGGCFEADVVKYKWMASSGSYTYWTMTPGDDSSEYMWYVRPEGYILRNATVHQTTTIAVRPVINLRKEYIK